MSTGKRILIAGCTGFLGQNLRARLEELGYQVTCSSRDAAFSGTYDAIINCAGELLDENKMIEANVILVGRLIRFAHQTGVPRFIQVGSSFEYDPANGQHDEDSLCAPASHYGKTKLAATHHVLAFDATHGADICVTVARPFNFYGPHDAATKYIPRLYDALVNETEFEIHPGLRDWFYVSDLVDGLVTILNAPKEKVAGQVFNFGSGFTTSNDDLAIFFNYAADDLKVGRVLKTRPVTGKMRAQDVNYWRADITKARNVLGWFPKVGVADGLKRYIQWRWNQDDNGGGIGDA